MVLKEVLLSEDGVTAVGRGFFSAEKFGRPTHVTGCLELWPGFTQVGVCTVGCQPCGGKMQLVLQFFHQGYSTRYTCAPMQPEHAACY